MKTPVINCHSCESRNPQSCHPEHSPVIPAQAGIQALSRSCHPERSEGSRYYKTRTPYIIITLAYMLAITYISLKPIPQAHHTGIAQQALNNFLHIPAYALLAYLISKCFQSARTHSYILSAIIAISFGATLELLQATIPGRTASIMDIALNTTGVILSLGFIPVILRRKPCVILRSKATKDLSTDTHHYPERTPVILSAKHEESQALSRSCHPERSEGSRS